MGIIEGLRKRTARKTKAILKDSSKMDKEALLRALLSELTPGWQSQPIFEQLARIMVLPTVDVVPIRVIDGKMEIGLAQRSKKDHWWPRKWHVSGAILLASDDVKNTHDLRELSSRLFGRHNELGGLTVVGELVFVDFRRTIGIRGHELTLVFYTEVEGNLENGRFFSLDEISAMDRESQLIEGHFDIILGAVEKFKSDALFHRDFLG